MTETKPVIFISHRSSDATVAEMLIDFLKATGIPDDYFFCSSIPGYDIEENISGEIKRNLRNSVVNIAILSHDYYQSPYCLNEAGIIWFNDDVRVIPVALPEIDSHCMQGFLNREYKPRRLDVETDITYIHDEVCKAFGVTYNKSTILLKEINVLISKYIEFINNRQIPETTTLASPLSIVTTDDERIVLYYLLTKKTRTITKTRVWDWVVEQEIYDVNIDNAFDLLSTIGATVVHDNTLEFDIDLFRQFTADNVELPPDIKQAISTHVHLSMIVFMSMWEKHELSDYEMLFVSYIVDERVSTFGDRWEAEIQIEGIKQWEQKNNLINSVSSNYNSLLDWLVNNRFVFESAWTSYGNVKEYTLCRSIRALLCGSFFPFTDELKALKNRSTIYAALLGN